MQKWAYYNAAHDARLKPIMDSMIAWGHDPVVMHLSCATLAVILCDDKFWRENASPETDALSIKCMCSILHRHPTCQWICSLACKALIKMTASGDAALPADLASLLTDAMTTHVKVPSVCFPAVTVMRNIVPRFAGQEFSEFLTYVEVSVVLETYRRSMTARLAADALSVILALIRYKAKVPSLDREVLELVLDCLRAHGNDLDVARCACELLRVTEAILQAALPCAELLVQTACLHHADVKLALSCLPPLELALRNGGMPAEFFSKGWPRDIVSWLEHSVRSQARDEDSVLLRAYACKILTHCARKDPKALDGAGDCGAVTAVLSAMNLGADSWYLADCACFFLGCMASRGALPATEAELSARAVLAAMTAFPGHLASAGTSALLHITLTVLPLSNKKLAIDCVAVMCGAMETNMQDKTICNNSLHALGHMCTVPALRGAMAASTTLMEVCLFALHEHRACFDALASLMTFFAHVIVEPGVAARLVECNAVADLNFALSMTWNVDSCAVGNCCCILANLSVDRRYRLKVCACLKNMVRVLRAHNARKEHSVAAADHVCIALHNLLSDAACVDEVVGTGHSVSALVRVAREATSDALLGRAMMAILALARSGHALGISELVRAGAVGAALRVFAVNERARLLLACLAERLSSRGAVFNATKVEMLTRPAADQGFLQELIKKCDTGSQQAEVRALPRVRLPTARRVHLRNLHGPLGRLSSWRRRLRRKKLELLEKWPGEFSIVVFSSPQASCSASHPPCLSIAYPRARAARRRGRRPTWQAARCLAARPLKSTRQQTAAAPAAGSAEASPPRPRRLRRLLRRLLLPRMSLWQLRARRLLLLRLRRLRRPSPRQPLMWRLLLLWLGRLQRPSSRQPRMTRLLPLWHGSLQRPSPRQLRMWRPLPPRLQRTRMWRLLPIGPRRI